MEADLGPMEFFLLAMIGRLGLKSLYELRQRAQLEPGGIRSAMKELEEEGLILRADPGKRRRRDLRLTTAGSELLHRSWPSCLREYGDADAVLRAAFVAWVMDAPDAAADYLKHIGLSRREGAQKLRNEAEHLKCSQTEPLSSYAWMRVSNEAHRRSAESDAFLSMCGSIRERFKDNATNATQSAVGSD